MRALKIICGLAVLFLALHMVHAIHHFFHMQGSMSAAMFWGLTALAALVELFSIMGGVLLLIGK